MDVMKIANLLNPAEENQVSTPISTTTNPALCIESAAAPTTPPDEAAAEASASKTLTYRPASEARGSSMSNELQRWETAALQTIVHTQGFDFLSRLSGLSGNERTKERLSIARAALLWLKATEDDVIFGLPRLPHPPYVKQGVELN